MDRRGFIKSAGLSAAGLGALINGETAEAKTVAHDDIVIITLREGVICDDLNLLKEKIIRACPALMDRVLILDGFEVAVASKSAGT